MMVHARARLTPNGRLFVVRRVLHGGWSARSAAEAAGVAERTVWRWLARYRAEGEQGLIDRSSAPRRIPHRTGPERVAAIAALRRLRLTAAEIAQALGMPLSTVSAVLARIGLGKRSRLEPPEPPNRYERRRPGELLHVDVKKLGRIARPGHRVMGRRDFAPGAQRRKFELGWEFVHVCVDDHSRLAYVEVLDDERGPTTAAFLRNAAAWFARHGINVERVLTDNGAGYRSTAHALACRELGLKHLRTRPYRPRTNGKAERFIQTLLHEWAYARLFANSRERTAALTPWLNHYNWHRPHGSLSHKPPGSRLTNAAGNYT